MPPVRRSSDTSFTLGAPEVFQRVRTHIRHYQTGRLPAQGDVGLTLAVAMTSAGKANNSNVLTVHTFLESAEYAKDRLQMQIVEGFVVAFILIAWICAILLFLHKWDKLRILPPADAVFKNKPKNLDRIKVVKRPTDSVIYRNYSRRMSKTMIAREKRLARMNTMPELQMHFDSAKIKKEKKLDRFQTMPIIEVNDTLKEIHTMPIFEVDDTIKENDSIPSSPEKT